MATLRILPISSGGIGGVLTGFVMGFLLEKSDRTSTAGWLLNAFHKPADMAFVWIAHTVYPHSSDAGMIFIMPVLLAYWLLIGVLIGCAYCFVFKNRGASEARAMEFHLVRAALATFAMFLCSLVGFVTPLLWQGESDSRSLSQAITIALLILLLALGLRRGTRWQVADFILSLLAAEAFALFGIHFTGLGDWFMRYSSPEGSLLRCLEELSRASMFIGLPWLLGWGLGSLRLLSGGSKMKTHTTLLLAAAFALGFFGCNTSNAADCPVVAAEVFKDCGVTNVIHARVIAWAPPQSKPSRVAVVGQLGSKHVLLIAIRDENRARWYEPHASIMLGDGTKRWDEWVRGYKECDHVPGPEDLLQLWKELRWNDAQLQWKFVGNEAASIETGMVSTTSCFGIPCAFSGKLTPEQEKGVPSELCGAFRIFSVRDVSEADLQQILKNKEKVAEETHNGVKYIAVKAFRSVHFSKQVSGMMIVIERYRIVDTEPKRPAKELTVDLGGGVKMELVLINAGSFMMGDDNGGDNERPVHKVIITKPFYLGKYEVTQEQWEAVMGDNPCQLKGRKNPVVQVSWEECQSLLGKLNSKRDGHGGKFALPTEAQWEYACRAGSATRYCFGDTQTQLNQYGWYSTEASERQSHPVGQKRPNAWGLFDMHGNVWEWCADWYNEKYYGASPTDDPTGPSSGSSRVIRGGGWADSAGSCRSVVRNDVDPGYRGGALGLRVLLVPAE
jgi:formylglycine-generating enzyme required for sulfatase activity